MGEDPRTGGAPVEAINAPRDPVQIREDIEATRRELGDTVEALVAKTDVKARAQEKIASARESVVRPVVLVPATVVVVVLAALLGWRRTRR
jgi:hypothetical protein